MRKRQKNNDVKVVVVLKPEQLTNVQGGIETKCRCKCAAAE